MKNSVKRQPLIGEYFQAQEREQQREIDFDIKVLEHETQRFQYGIVAGSAVGGAVLILAGVLIMRGDAPAARDLIALVVTAAGAWFGGYGMATRRGGRGAPEE